MPRSFFYGSLHARTFLVPDYKAYVFLVPAVAGMDVLKNLRFGTYFIVIKNSLKKIK